MKLAFCFNSIEICQQYERYSFCHDIEGYGDGNWTVFVDRSPSTWGPLGLDSINQYLSELLLQLTMDIENDTWSPGCEHSTRQLLCHTALPFCKKQGEIAICRLNVGSIAARLYLMLL